MPCTEAYREHIMYTFNGFCKTVIRFAAINAWRDRSRRRQKEISLEYLTEEKFYPLSTSDEALKSPYEQYPITICGQTIILTNGELAAALLSLPEYDRVSNPQEFTAPAKEKAVEKAIAALADMIPLEAIQPQSPALVFPGLEIRLHQRRVFTKAQIFESVWSMESESCQSSVASVICSLRKKIEPDNRKPTCIKTVTGVGYKFASGE